MSEEVEVGKVGVLVLWLIVVVLLTVAMATLTTIAIPHWVGLAIMILLVIAGFVTHRTLAPKVAK